jgi:hypothetical protein
MNPLLLAQLCANIYTSANGLVTYDADGVYAGYCGVESANTFVFRGSDNTQDWLDDFYCIPTLHSKLGTCHAGMLRGIDACYAWVRNVLASNPASWPIYLTGHSLGGAHARLIAGLLAADGIKVASLVTFGSPKPACLQLKNLIASNGMQHVSYRHMQDMVPTLPPDVLGYIHTEPWTELEGSAGQDFEPATDHSINLYVQCLS